MVEYNANRLLFRADVIEKLDNDDYFVINTPKGSFMMTKADFYDTFRNVVESNSYRNNGIYHYSSMPQKALKFLSDNNRRFGEYKSMNMNKQDNVGDIIRCKISELGKIWKQSPYNPTVDKDIVNQWDKLIQEWISDVGIPLIIRKNLSNRGQVFTHSTGREIIVSDNSFAIWVFHCVLHKKFFSLSLIKEMLEKNMIPMVYMQTKDIKEKAKYTRTLSGYDLSGWKLCHIKPVGFNTNTPIECLRITDIQEHFNLYANPKNMFVLPKEIGALGEIKEFIDEQI